MKQNVIVFVAIVFCLCLSFGAQGQNITTNAQNCTPSQVKQTSSADLPPIPSWHPALNWLSPQSQAVLNRTMANAGATAVYPNLNNSACYSEFLKYRNRTDTRFAQNYKKLYMPYTVKNDTIDGVKVTWVTTPNTTIEDRVIIYLHWGRFMYGNSYAMAPGIVPIADTSNIKAVSVDYRLVPEHPYPAAIEDIRKVYNWLLENGYRNENIAFYGDSSGGNLAMATTLMLKDEGLPLPGAVAVASPPLDLSKVSDSFYTLSNVDPITSFSGNDKAYGVYVGKENLTNPYISPMYGNYTGFPPLYIQVGERELYLSGCSQTALKAYHAGVPVVFNVWDAMWHIFSTNDPQLPESRQANRDAAEFIARNLGIDNE